MELHFRKIIKKLKLLSQSEKEAFQFTISKFPSKMVNTIFMDINRA